MVVEHFRFGRVEFAAEPDIRAHRSNRCRARGARIFVLRLLEFRGKTPEKGWDGSVSGKSGCCGSRAS